MSRRTKVAAASRWDAAAAARWPDADLIASLPDDAPEAWATVSLCGRHPRVVLHPTRTSALADFWMIERSNGGSVLGGIGCGRHCYSDHAVIDMTADGNAIADRREFGVVEGAA